MMCHRIGRGPIGSSGLGISGFTSPMRVPRPPHRMIVGRPVSPTTGTVPALDRASTTSWGAFAARRLRLHGPNGECGRRRPRCPRAGPDGLTTVPPSRVLVTGAAGFVGGHLIRRLGAGPDGFAVNAHGTEAILEAVRRAGAAARVVVASTDALTERLPEDDY